jgi:hypothetical protein
MTAIPLPCWWVWAWWLCGRATCVSGPDAVACGVTTRHDACSSCDAQRHPGFASLADLNSFRSGSRPHEDPLIFIPLRKCSINIAVKCSVLHLSFGWKPSGGAVGSRREVGWTPGGVERARSVSVSRAWDARSPGGWRVSHEPARRSPADNRVAT